LTPGTTLRIRVFDNPGQPSAQAQVAVFAAGRAEPVATWAGADAQFALAPGRYDVQVVAAAAEQWLRGVAVPQGGLAAQDVVFDFGSLAIRVVHGAETPRVDIVIYPAGQRETWAAWLDQNPASARLPAGVYDIEVARPDLRGSQTVRDVTVRPGETVTVTVTIDLLTSK
jgi:hypothetical protein